MNIKQSIIIKALPKVVYAYLEDPEKQKLWITGLVNTEYLDKDQKNFVVHIKEGSKVKEYKGSTIDHNKPYLLKVSLGDKNFTVITTYTLEEVNSCTKLNYHAEIVLHSLLAKVMFTLSFFISILIVKKQIKGLQKIIEQQ